MPRSSSPRSGELPATALVLLASVTLAHEQDVVLSRQRARQVAQLLGFDSQDQVRIAAAASEIAREGLQTGEQATLALLADPDEEMFLIQLQFPGQARHDRTTADFQVRDGVLAARRIMGHFAIVPAEEGTILNFGRALPKGRKPRDGRALAELSKTVASSPPRNLYQEFQAQNKELLDALQDLRRNQAELAQVNRELEATNRGVLALYAELEEQALSLRRTSEQKTRFYSSISHEFRTPVTSILTLCQILIDRLDGELTAEQERQVSLIRHCGRNLLEWVNDLLDLARVEAGRMELRLSEFTLRELMTGLRGVMRPLVPGEGVALVFEDHPEREDVLLHSDEGKLSQILRNFISNALKFTEKGEVRVSVDTSAPDGTICFSVRDTGIGIAAEDQERIFDEFVQVDGPLQRKAKGTGLGLPLSRRLASLLGGAIRVTSTPGEGSLFQLIVPRTLEAAAAGPRETIEPEPRTSPATDVRALVLIVDDDEASRYLLRQALSKLPVEIREAPDGFAALDLAEQLVPRAIFLDLGMPVLGGYEVLESLKLEPRTRDIPVMIYTSEEIADTDPRLKEHAFAVLHKPADEEGLPVHQIREALERARVIEPEEQDE